VRICKIWDADYPWDVRVEKVAASLSAAGHAVHLVCRNQGRRPREEWTGAFTIHRLPSIPALLGPAHTICNFPFPANPFWIHAIAQTVRRIEADVILVRDLPLALPAAFLGKIHGIPVILDLAENYPAMLEDRFRYTPTTAIDRFARNPAMARFAERLAIRLADHIIVVVEESRERLIRAGVEPDRITIVCNTPRPDRWTLPLLRQNEGKELHAIYLGNLDGSRGIDTAILAVRELANRNRFVRLTVVGDGPSLTELRDLARRAGVDDRVAITGRLPFPEVQSLLARADVGLIPHYATDAWNSTIPNKLFDYMLAGLPVVVSDAKPAARIVTLEQCGDVFADRDVRDLARCLDALGDRASRLDMGRRGQAAVRRQYHWDHDARALFDVIERVKAAKATSPARRKYASALSPGD
jgi:glycosyltransferase involved in cell wall biosynthesis